MKRIITLAFSVLLLSILCTMAFAQDKTQAYYVSHQTEILTDAQAAFRKGEYEMAEKLCSWHYIIVGDKRADALREKASKCAQLIVEMREQAAREDYTVAREKASAILALNPEDKTAKELLFPPSREEANGHEWVDLGLSVKWATCNVGATKPEEYGDYYAWGETSPKNEYSRDNYVFHVSGNMWSNVMLSKYNTDSDRGEADYKQRLDMSDDAARVNWGERWRMPTDNEWTELREFCTWTWTSQNGKNGYEVTSKKNQNSIFLPAAGYRMLKELCSMGTYGSYWSSSLDVSRPFSAWYLHFQSDKVCRYNYVGREYGFSVRPVIE